MAIVNSNLMSYSITFPLVIEYYLQPIFVPFSLLELTAAFDMSLFNFPRRFLTSQLLVLIWLPPELTFIEIAHLRNVLKNYVGDA